MRRSLRSSRAALAAASLSVCAVFWANPGDAFAQANDAATSAPAANGAAQYAVKPGQSLTDIAGELTGSKDRDVRARAARALFDANPNAFGNHDINKLRLGAVLNVPAELSGASASAAASAHAAQESAPAEAPAAGSTTPEPASGSAAAPASPVAPEASTPGNVASASAQTPETASAPAVTASAPASTAPAPQEGASNTPVIVGVVIAAIIVLLLLMRRGKRRDAPIEEDDRSPRSFGTLEEAQADADARNEALRKAATASAAGVAAAAHVDGKPDERGGSGLDAVATSVDSAEATQAPVTPSGDAEAELPPTTEAHADKPEPSQPEPRETAAPATEAEPFVPVAPAARHPDFVPPMPVTLANAPRTSSAQREAEKWEAEEREAAARQAAAQQAEARESRAREAESRDAEVRETTEREEQAREAAAREIIAHEAELRELKARAADEQEPPGAAPDDEPAIAHSFPMPKFPQEAIRALGSLDMNLPPCMELKISPSVDAEPATPPPSRAASAPGQTLPPPLEAPPSGAQPIEQPPFVPQPVAQAHSAPQASSVANKPQSVTSQIEAGTAGPASVAGLGATRFGPLSLDFDLGPSSTATEPLPAMTPAQLATIARNKLELAAEYIELGDLQGARTLLQEVIESNDPATRQQAATLLSTLAPHS
ncbi:putative transmembrane protein [Candidatus Paraburkholderia schumanniana]|nr:putative transmembrane protein [Candidatus Paraburkholderia schumannianae]